MRKFLGPLRCTTAGAPGHAGPAAPPCFRALPRTLSPALRRTPVALRAPACSADDVRKRRGGDPAGPRLVSRPDAAWAGALFAAVDARV
ncbi:hypothetical protein [Streptomyces sp. NPDC048192]|jgi:hypothetical protein|uniref:hypothetical protein n=1 Tax=unclassified Streptomyces TaxID=2593676 RepID=UPI0037134184